MKQDKAVIVSKPIKGSTTHRTTTFTFNKDCNVINIMNGIEHVHSTLLKMLDSYSQDESKRMSVTIEQLLKQDNETT